MTNIASELAIADLPAMSDVEVRRLGWRCRRGLLELDIVLQRFSAQHLAGLSPQQLAAFDVLLNYTDNELLDVVTLRIDFACAETAAATGLNLSAMQQLLAKLRSSKINTEFI